MRAIFSYFLSHFLLANSPSSSSSRIPFVSRRMQTQSRHLLAFTFISVPQWSSEENVVHNENEKSTDRGGEGGEGKREEEGRSAREYNAKCAQRVQTKKGVKSKWCDVHNFSFPLFSFNSPSSTCFTFIWFYVGITSIVMYCRLAFHHNFQATYCLAYTRLPLNYFFSLVVFVPARLLCTLYRLSWHGAQCMSCTCACFANKIRHRCLSLSHLKSMDFEMSTACWMLWRWEWDEHWFNRRI